MTTANNDQPSTDAPPEQGEILLVLDACAGNLASIRIAGRVAQAMRSRLKVLCVEDQRLLVAADLPFTREFRYRSTRTTKLTGKRVVRELDAFSDAARAQFERLLTESRIRGTFDVMRTEKHTLLTRLISASEMLYLTGLAPGYVQQQETRPRPRELVYLLFDATPAAERALRIACEVCRAAGADLRIVYSAATDREQLDSLLASFACNAQLYLASGENGILRVAKSLAGRMQNILVVPDTLFGKQDKGSLLDLLERSPCHAVIVR